MKKKLDKNTKSSPGTSEILSLFVRCLEKFVDMPTKSHLEEFMSIGNLYKESWIQDVAEDTRSTSSKDLLKILQDNSPLDDNLQNFLDQNPSQKEIYVKTQELIESSWGNPEIVDDLVTVDAEDLSREGERGLPNFNVGKMLLDQESALLDKKTKTAYSKTGMESMTSREINRAESNDGETKLITYSVNVQPQSATHGDTLIPLEEIDFCQHSIRGIRKRKTDGKLFNRRWYFEKEGDKKIAWWSRRDQMMTLLENANAKGMLNTYLDDERIKDYKIIKSMSLNPEEYKAFLDSFTLYEERDSILRSPDVYYFLIVETKYPKTPSQLKEHAVNKTNNKEAEVTWRDICIVNSEETTIRSVTNDKTHRPSIPIGDSQWYITNDMTSFPNQVMREFSKLIHPSLKINAE